MRFFLSLIFILFLSSKVSGQSRLILSDAKASQETKNLYAGLVGLSTRGILFGHHDDLAYGVGWRGDKGRSDIKSVTGTFPALYGWDLSGLEKNSEKDINGIPFSDQKNWIKEVYERGGINTFCWHLQNPVNQKSAWDTSIRTVKEILPGGKFHESYREYLNRIATYISQLKGDRGESIPILFRPFHELTGTWFWWCRNTCSAEEFKGLWRFTIDYLRNTKGLHNLILVYSVADFKNKNDLLSRYPGDDYVDIIGFDAYCRNNVEQFISELDHQLGLTVQFCKERGKIPAIPETGYQGIPQADWWTKVLLPIISRYPISYVMLWRNGGPDHFFAPYPGQLSAADFLQFSKSDRMIFQDGLNHQLLYSTPAGK